METTFVPLFSLKELSKNCLKMWIDRNKTFKTITYLFTLFPVILKAVLRYKHKEYYQIFLVYVPFN